LAWKAFTNALRYCLIIVPSVTVLGFIFATFVNQRWPGYVVARIAFFSPYITSATVIGLVWVWLLDTRYGIINQYFGLQIPWLTSTSWSLIGISLASIWWDLGLAFVLFLAGLQDIDPEVREASTVDGASRLQTTWYVVLPLLRPTLTLVITLQTITTLRIFSQIDLMTQGGPSTSSMSVITYLYQYGIKKYEYGFAASVALILFAVIMVITVVHRRIVREQV
jgi:multiple sugar transport system permease protein